LLGFFIACSGFDFNGVGFCVAFKTLSATDADAGDTLTYTLTNNNAAYFAISGNTLKLAKTVDYQTTKNVSITVRVTDTNSHTLDKNFTFTITNPNINSPTDITLSMGGFTDSLLR
jgi:hypothetical protein